MIRIIILTVALLAGGGAAWLAYTALTDDASTRQSAEAQPQVPTTAVLAAATKIGRGEQLGPANLTWQDWPKDAISEAAIQRDTQPDAIDSYSGWTSRAVFLPGEPIRVERLVEGTGGLMSVMLDPGMRAVSIPVSAETGAGGFVMPEDRVDLVHTVVADTNGDGAGETVSRTIIRNVRVLAIDQMSEQAEEGAAKVASTVTIELTPKQVEALSSARNSGRLSLALRSVADFDEPVVSDEGDAPAAAPEPAPAQTVAAEEPADRKPTRIRIIGSGNLETLEFERREG